MLSTQKLVDALHEFISTNGFIHFLHDSSLRPVTPIEPVPSFLVNRDEARRILERNSRVSSSESTPDKSLEDQQLEVPSVTPESNTPPKWVIVNFNRKSVREKLLAFLRSRLACPNLEIKLLPRNPQTGNLPDLYEKFPFSVGCNTHEVVVACSIPDSVGIPTPESAVEASIKYTLLYMPTIGQDYSAITNITTQVPDELNANGTPKKATTPPDVEPKTIAKTFLYKAQPSLSHQQLADLADGRANMLISQEDTMKVLATVFLNALFLDPISPKDVEVAENSVALMLSLVSKGKMLCDDLTILKNNYSHHIDPKDSNKINFKNVCTAIAVFAPYYSKDKMEMVLNSTLVKTVNDKGEVHYSVEKFDVQINFKDKSVLKCLTGSSETILRFDDGGRGISHDLLRDPFSKNFHNYCLRKPSLLRRILGIPVSIVKFIFNVIVKCVTFPFSLVARCFSKVVGLFCSKPSSTDASLDSPKQTTSVASNTSKGQSTETVGKVSPAKDKGGAIPVEHHKQAASPDKPTQPPVTSGVMGKDQVALDKTGTSVLKEGDPSTVTTVKSSLTGVEPAALAADKAAIASAPAAR